MGNYARRNWRKKIALIYFRGKEARQDSTYGSWQTYEIYEIIINIHRNGSRSSIFLLFLTSMKPARHSSDAS